ncbi:MAG: Rrf2 family transcriptional regulator [Vallitaleaceae bacterium]|jgi:Rrf2 family transcriptional regulator, cysteine metabolism repressor|nr:Rrf2 family transcriptional regulator [Vallitaleaceae bacterium]
MKISTKGRYGLRALVDLVLYSQDRHVALTEIATRQKISEIYLEQIFSTLRKRGIVNSVKGPLGGYFLAHKAKEITVGKVLRALEGELSVIDDQVKEVFDPHSITYCIKTQVWEKIDEQVNHLADSYTLEDLAQEYRKKMDIPTDMYFI